MAVRPSASARTNWLSGHFELGFGRQSHQTQAFSQLHEEMSRALDRIAPPDVDKVLDHHGLVAGGGPHERRAEAEGTE
jgi:hypothetical protein